MFRNSPTPQASSPAPARRRHGRLLAACTTGVLAASALALGPAGLAHADARSGAHAQHVVPSVKPVQQQRPTLTLPSRKSTLAASPKGVAPKDAAAGTQLTTPWFDTDGDGISDVITQEDDRTIQLLPSASTDQQPWKNLGQASVMYKDILTPGDLTSSLIGSELLTLTTGGQLSLWDHSVFPGGNPSWTGSGWQIYNKIIAVGDITGDGFGDLLARTPSGDLYLYKSTGNAASPFAGRVKVGYGYDIYDQLIGGGDLTGSGHESLVARDLDGNLWMYALDGTAAQPLAARVRIGTGWGIYNQLIGWGDQKDRMGGIDARAANGDLFLYQGDGTGHLTSRYQEGAQWNSRLIAGQGSVPVWGKDNLFALTPGGNLYFYYGNRTGTFGPRIQVGAAGDWKPFYPIASASLTQADEEPLLEIAGSALVNDTDSSAGLIGYGWNIYNQIFGPGDLTNEGNGDLLARDTSGVLWLYPGKGTGTSFYNRIRIGGGWGGYTRITGAGDINGDGYADILARDAGGHLYIYHGTGNGNAPFSARVDLGGGWNAFTKLVSPGDLDGDGRADLCAVTSGGQLYRYSGSGRNGTATFKPRVMIGSGGWDAFSAIA